MAPAADFAEWVTVAKKTNNATIFLRKIAFICPLF
jgi:hypothetical protein